MSIGSRVFLVEGTDFAQLPIELGPLEFDLRPGFASELYAAPTQDGTAVWVVQTALTTASGQSYNTQAHLVAADGSGVLSSVEDSRKLVPIGTTAEKDLVVTNEQGVLLTVTAAGEVAVIGSGRAVGVGRNHIVWVAESGDLVALSDKGERRVPVPVSDGIWVGTGHALIPSVQILGLTVTDDGRVLAGVVEAAQDQDIGPHRQTLYLVDFDRPNGAATPVLSPYEQQGAVWTDRGRSVLLLGSHRVEILDLSSDGSVELLHQFDSDHFVLAAF